MAASAWPGRLSWNDNRFRHGVRVRLNRPVMCGRRDGQRRNRDGALIDIDEGRANADCRRTISRVVGQRAAVERVLREEDR